MRLLHGTNEIICRPDISKCRSKNDFGKGFYLTPSWNRAWEMGRRRVEFYGGSITVNAFNYEAKSANAQSLKVLRFEGFTVDWARFVIQNRDIHFFNHPYDIVIGPVADAIIDTELFKYRNEFGVHYLDEKPLKIFIDRISQFGSSYIQYCFCTQRAMDILKKI